LSSNILGTRLPDRRFQSLTLAGSFTHGGRFSHCGLVGQGRGSDRDYLLTGASSDVAGGSLIYNLAFRFLAMGKVHNTWQGSFFFRKVDSVSGTSTSANSNDSSLGAHVVLMEDLMGGLMGDQEILTDADIVISSDDAALTSSQEKVYDLVFMPGQKVCRQTILSVHLCLSAVMNDGAAGSTTAHNSTLDYYVSLGNANGRSSGSSLLSPSLDTANSESSGEIVSWRIASQSASTGTITMVNSGVTLADPDEHQELWEKLSTV
jgi:hypothetical protein